MKMRMSGGLTSPASIARRRRWRSIIPVVALGVCALAGCSNNTPKPPGTSSSPTPMSPSPTTASPTGTSGALPAYCEPYAKIKASIEALNPNSGVAGIQTALSNIQTNLNEFAAAAHSQFGPQVTQLRSALDNLKKAVQAAAASPNPANISAATTAASGVASAYTALQQAVGNHCG